MCESTEVAPEIVERTAAVCLALPDAYEEDAWVGTRWRVRKRTFAHVLVIQHGRPPAYARAAETTGPATVVTFRLPLSEVDALAARGFPYFCVQWGRDVAGVVLDGDVDWDELAEMLTESYRVMAPRKLVRRIESPPG